MELSQLKYFQVIARLENISQAAEELFVSQPGLSRSITRLEEELGVPLFERRKGLVTLNRYGELFLESVNEVFDILETETDHIRQLYNQEQNILTVTCTVEKYLADRLSEFSVRYPNIAVRQRTLSFSEIEKQLLGENLDMAFCCKPINNIKISFELLVSGPYIVVIGREHKLARQTVISLEALKDYSFICDNPHLDRQDLNNICKDAGFTPKISYESDNIQVLMNLLTDNESVVLMPLAYYLKIISQYGRETFRAIRVREKLPPAEFGVVYRNDHHFASASIHFINYVRNYAREEQKSVDDFLETDPMFNSIS